MPPNKSYFIKVCCEPKYKQIKIRLIDKLSDKILYDNVSADLKESVSLTIDDHPTQILVEITVIQNIVKKKNSHDDPDNTEVENVCAGIWIFFKNNGINAAGHS